MFRKLFKIKPKRFLGIDIGTSSVKVVEIVRQGNGLILENYGEAVGSLSEKKAFKINKRDALLSSNKEIADDIRNICNRAKILTKEANFGVPDFSSFYTNIELPIMAKDEVFQAIQYEVRPYIPLPLSEITLDWFVTEGEIAKSPIKILVVAIPNDIIARYQEIASYAGLELKFLEPEVFSLTRSCVKKEDKGKVLGLIDIGAKSTTCSVIEKGILKSSHSFNLAGNELTDSLARSFNIEYNEAEKIKKRVGLAYNEESSNVVAKKVKNILYPLAHSIIEESKKVFRDYYRNRGVEVEKIILAGGGSLLPGLRENFEEEAKKETVIIDPFSEVSFSPALKSVLENNKAFIAISVGLALRGFKNN